LKVQTKKFPGNGLTRRDQKAEEMQEEKNCGRTRCIDKQAVGRLQMACRKGESTVDLW